MSNSYAISLRDAIICLNGFASDMHSEYKKKGVNVQLGFDAFNGFRTVNVESIADEC